MNNPKTIRKHFSICNFADYFKERINLEAMARDARIPDFVESIITDFIDTNGELAFKDLKKLEPTEKILTWRKGLITYGIGDFNAHIKGRAKIYSHLMGFPNLSTFVMYAVAWFLKNDAEIDFKI